MPRLRRVVAAEPEPRRRLVPRLSLTDRASHPRLRGGRSPQGLGAQPDGAPGDRRALRVRAWRPATGASSPSTKRAGNPSATPRGCASVSTSTDPSCASATTRAGRRPLGPVLDATVLSDEHAEEMEGERIRALGFTGAFVGLWAWDLTGGGLPADFDEATYRT
ncbi:hypothetical protein OHB25_12625 [Streptomyces mirabilis]|uniref:beta-xylosidase family glycoside hydrolase n=1 Tax=Streptomyces TaxID=1883 RepID=UPI0013D92DF5|nr:MULTISPECIES: hypothetical protein [Streptomyces]MCX4614158.1 hypothetical protein [Streptomyces mirabilis]MCX5354285.1 hypothetical protein [Streptomyces mirabilis]